MAGTAAADDVARSPAYHGRVPGVRRRAAGDGGGRCRDGVDAVRAAVPATRGYNPPTPIAPPDHPPMPHPLLARTRRHFFRDCGVGVGKVALLSLLANRAAAGAGAAHHTATAKRVIFLFQAGAPSQFELFDHKPKLAALEGQSLPESVTKGLRLAFIQPDAAVLGPRFGFRRWGRSGMELSEAIPHLGGVADELCLIRTVHTDQFNHAPAQLLMNTGSALPGRPSLGAWLSYGLGSETDDLPAFVVLQGSGNLSGGAAMWGNGVLPGRHQGVPFRGGEEPILHLSNPPGVDARAQRDTLDLIGTLNRGALARTGDETIRTRLAAYETAFRMQSAAPELTDLSGETAETLELYGAEPGNDKKSFANHCLLARRLAERGVRFTQVYHAGWDHHSDVEGGVKREAAATDRASAALLTDLKRRGLLEDTLVIWGGEFGRTPMVESSAALKRSAGRDHHPHAYSLLLAGGGVRGGLTHGTTDELGFTPVEHPVHVHDVQATILHCLGIDHRHLSVDVGGLDVRLTGVEPHAPVREILA